jgi:hypothetical protein
MEIFSLRADGSKGLTAVLSLCDSSPCAIAHKPVPLKSSKTYI